MEIIIALVVLAGLLYWFFFRTEEVVKSVPYKVETPPAVAEEAKPTLEFKEVTVDLAPAVVAATVVVAENAVVPEAIVAPAKKPRKPRTPKVVAEPVKVAAKKAAPVKKAAVKKPVARSVVKSKKA